MKILVFTDIHGDYRALERLMELEADYYFAAGDLVSWGRGLDRCGEIMQRRGERVYVLPGNHESIELTEALCQKFKLHYFHERSFEAGGYHIAGLGYSTPTPFHTPGEYSEEEMAQHLAPFAGLKPLVLVCHCPPLGTALDRVREGVHGARFHRPAAAGGILLRPHSRGRGDGGAHRSDARVQRRPKGPLAGL
jgi:hypothetical protein